MAARTSSRDLPLRKQLLFSIILVLCVFGLAEGAVRVWAFYFRTSYERYNSATGRLELVPHIRYVRDGNEFAINSRGLLGPEFADLPADGVDRIVAIGDSCTFSEGFWKLAYPAILQQILIDRTGRRFEVLNAGIEGYDSSFALSRLQDEIIGYKPRLVTIYIGWNDLMKADPANAGAAGQHARLARWMESSYLMKAYKKVMFLHLRPLLFKPAISNDEREARAYDGFVPLRYRHNLEAMVRALRSHGIQAMLFTLPTVVVPEMTREELRRQNVFFPYFAGTYSVARFLSLHRAYNRVIRSVGRDLDVPVVDLDGAFNQHRKAGLFWDTMHPSREGHRLIAETVYRRMTDETAGAKELSARVMRAAEATAK
jgi:lysophospholipase L1-like esterase